jgi:plasmid segregation protein ParM
MVRKTKAKATDVEVLGLDVGYAMTKVCTKDDAFSFRSTIKTGSIDVNRDDIVIGMAGKTYTVGASNGTGTTKRNKIYTEVFDVCVMSAIVKAFEDKDEINVNLVTGLPISYYNGQRAKLIEALKGREEVIMYKKRERKIKINDCIVFPQSAGIKLLHKKDISEKTQLVIDIGGLTVDVSYFEKGVLVSYKSYPLGVLKFYSYLVQQVAEELSIDYTVATIEDAIDDGIIYDEEKIDFDFKQRFEYWLNQIIEEIRVDFPYDSVFKKTWMGGGSLRFKPYIKKDRGVKIDEVYTNAKAFYAIGDAKFGEEN